MDTKQILEHLNDLCQTDIDAVATYDQAIQNTSDPNVRNHLEKFKQDHERHVTELSNHIKKHGGHPPSQKTGFTGFFKQGFTAIRAAIGNEGALQAMRSNEKTTNEAYAKATEWEVPDDIKQLIEKNYEDEQRHLEYIEEALRTRPWEKRPQA